MSSCFRGLLYYCLRKVLCLNRLVFDYYHKDDLCSHVEVDTSTGSISVTDYTDEVLFTVFGKRPHTVEELNAFFESRCFPRGRADEKEILEYLGLRQYNPLDIVRITHGVLFGSFSWLKFEGEGELCWDDLDPFRK